MSTYHLDPSLSLAASLNPVLDEIAALQPEQAIMLDQGAALAVTVLDDAMQEVMENLAQQYATICGERLASLTVESIFQPFVEAAGIRTRAIADAVNAALEEGCTCEEEEQVDEGEVFDQWFNDLFGLNGPLGGAA